MRVGAPMVQRGRVTAWVGWVWFAAVCLLVVGLFNIVAGSVAIWSPKNVLAVSGDGVAVVDVSTWGWVHLVLGVVMTAAGGALFGGARWARLVAIVLVTVNLLVQFVSLPVTPFWSLAAAALDLVVLWALIVHGAEVESATGP